MSHRLTRQMKLNELKTADAFLLHIGLVLSNCLTKISVMSNLINTYKYLGPPRKERNLDILVPMLPDSKVQWLDNHVSDARYDLLRRCLCKGKLEF